jgi:hypothetical protein
MLCNKLRICKTVEHGKCRAVSNSHQSEQLAVQPQEMLAADGPYIAVA